MTMSVFVYSSNRGSTTVLVSSGTQNEKFLGRRRFSHNNNQRTGTLGKVLEINSRFRPKFSSSGKLS